MNFLVLLLILLGLNENNLKNKEKNNFGCLNLDVVLLTDMSGSVWRNEQFIARALTAFVERFELSESTMKISIIRFSDDAIVLNNLTTDKETLNHSINNIRTKKAIGSTNMTFGLLTAMNELFYNGRKTSKKLIILITDGAPNYPHETIRTADEIKNLYLVDICGIFVDSSSGNSYFLEKVSSSYCYSESNYEQLTELLKTIDICF